MEQRWREGLHFLEQEAALQHVPIIKAQTRAFIERICQAHQPKRILEIGTAIGYSATAMFLASAGKPLIDSIEIRKDRVLKAREFVAAMQLSAHIRVIYGDAFKVLPFLTGPYDFIFMDAAKGQYIELFPECERILEDGALLVTDNMFVQGLMYQEEKIIRRKRTMVRKVREYLALLSGPNKKTSLFSIGDGIALTLIKKA